MNVLEAVVLLSILSYCAIGADLGQWGQWTACSKTCGPGQQTRSWPCAGGNECNAQRNATRPCNKGPCKPGKWNDWTAWGPCSKTCGRGSKSRSRVCVGGGAGGPGCPGSAKNNAPCNPAPCPVGKWNDWSVWAACSKTCGGGFKTRSRACMGGEAGGPGCPGSARENTTCNAAQCGLGQWGEWNPFGACSKTCGAGQQSRIRNCMAANCTGSAKEGRPCNIKVCNVWAQWQPFGACSKTCGEGQKTRKRFCSGGGCVGNSEETERCNTRACNGNSWNEWGSWSACSQTCGQGMMTRSRTCSGGVGRCQGYGQFTDTCTKGTCENLKKGQFGAWSPWGRCTRTCGSGERVRNRSCTGGSCAGPKQEIEQCNSQAC